MRHTETNQLWLQDNVSSKDISVSKIAGTEAVADAMTKYAGSSNIEFHRQKTGQSIESGRHEITPSI